MLLGGGIGSVCRYGVAEISPRFYKGAFPMGTFIVNILGCFIIGILAAILQTHSDLDLLLVVGFCGGFTTFSSFSKETFSLFDRKRVGLALFYVLSSCLLGLVAVWLGFVIIGGKF